jgi:hypothetical protein
MAPDGWPGALIQHSKPGIACAADVPCSTQQRVEEAQHAHQEAHLMEQAPDYQESAHSGEQYFPQKPAASDQPRQAPRITAPLTTPAAAHVAADWVHWGPIWAGFIMVISTLTLLGALGVALDNALWRANGSATFTTGWAIFSGVVAFILGGWIAGRASGAETLGASALNSALVWGLSVVLLLVLLLITIVTSIVSISNAVGGISIPLLLLMRAEGARPRILTPGQAQATAWASFATLAIGLLLAIFGGLLSMRHTPALTEEPGKNQKSAG